MIAGKAGKMKSFLNGPKSVSLVFLAVLVILATLCFCAGCDHQQGVKIGDKAPGISGNDIQGEYVSLSRLKGKVVVIYFWTSSCCGDNLNQLEGLYSKFKYKGMEILAINEIDSREDVASYAKNNALTFTMLTDEHQMLFKQYQAFGFPTIFIVDRSGIIREKILGQIQTAKLGKLVSGYLDDKP